MNQALKLIVGLVVTILSFGYFLPVMVAWTKSRSNTSAIFALNLFLGWTLVGWVASLVWALKEPNSALLQRERILA